MRSGFTFVELLVTMSIMVLLATLTLPLALSGDQGRADATARILAGDLEHAQVLALSRPDLRVALWIDADGTGWSIVDADNPNVPLIDRLDGAHGGRSLRTVLGEGRAAVSADVLVTPGGQLLVFTSLGGLEVRPPQLQASMGSATATLVVDGDTGFATRID